MGLSWWRYGFFFSFFWFCIWRRLLEDEDENDRKMKVEIEKDQRVHFV